jgi:hypothetical protein
LYGFRKYEFSMMVVGGVPRLSLKIFRGSMPPPGRSILLVHHKLSSFFALSINSLVVRRT